jgi:hypothetical protein
LFFFDLQFFFFLQSDDCVYESIENMLLVGARALCDEGENRKPRRELQALGRKSCGKISLGNIGEEI